MIMLVRSMNFSSASQVLSLIGPERHTARLLPDGTRADLAAVSPVAHSLTSVPLPSMPDRTSGSRRLVPLGAAVERSEMAPVRRFRSLDRHRADRPLDPTAELRRCLCSDTQRQPAAGTGDNSPRRALLALNVSAMPTINLDGPLRPVTGGTGTIMPKPLPETGQFENSVVDFAAWKRSALADQTISHEEAMQLVEITGQMAKTGNAIVRTVSFVIKCLTGARGMDSVAVKRAYEERQAELIYLDAYRDRDPNGPIAA